MICSRSRRLCPSDHIWWPLPGWGGRGPTVLPSAGVTTECPAQVPRGQCLADRPTVSIWGDQPTCAGSDQGSRPLGGSQPLPEKAGKIHFLRTVSEPLWGGSSGKEPLSCPPAGSPAARVSAAHSPWNQGAMLSESAR